VFDLRYLLYKWFDTKRVMQKRNERHRFELMIFYVWFLRCKKLWIKIL